MRVYVAFVFAYFLVFATFHAWLLLMAWIELRRHASDVMVANLSQVVRSPLSPPISILVPAYNESAGIIDSVRSLLALEYPTFEVVVINDGSTDETLERLIEAFDLYAVDHPTPPFVEHEPMRGVYLSHGPLPVRVLDKENGGKADSLNAGINFAEYPLVCAIDADSVLEQDALAKTALPFAEDPQRTIATGGLIRVANGCRVEGGRVAEARLPRGGLPMFQVVEYLRAFFAARTGWSAVNGLLIVSGAFGVFRKDAVIAVGGYRTDTVGEDMELVVRLHHAMRKQGREYRIVYVPDPVCWTEAPEHLSVLRRQRRRWHRGSVESLYLHAGMLFNPRYGSVGLLAMPALLLFEILGPVIELAGYAVATIAFATGAINLPIFALFLAISVLYGLVLSFGAIALEDASFGRHAGWNQLRRVLGYAVLENLGYRQLNHLFRVEGFWNLVRGGEWGAMPRRGLSGEREVEEPVPTESVGLR